MWEQGRQSKTFCVGGGGAVDPSVVEKLSVEEGERSVALIKLCSYDIIRK